VKTQLIKMARNKTSKQNTCTIFWYFWL